MPTYQCVWSSGIAYIPTSSPCGPINKTHPVVPCCANGDFCLSDNICAYTSHSATGGSGYYSAGCSNGTILDQGDSSSACVDRCADTGLPDIVYDSSDGSWKCCGGNENERNCQSPTNDTFVGAAPSDLVTVWLAGSTATTASSLKSTSTISAIELITITTTTTTLTVAAAATTTSTDLTITPAATKTEHSSGLSTGAKAGIGIGVSILVLTLLALTLVYFHRRRKRNIEHPGDMTQKETGRDQTISQFPPLYEASSETSKIYELSPDSGRLVELST